MNKSYKVLQLIRSICGTSPMKCHDVSYASVRQHSGLNARSFAQALDYLKKAGHLMKDTSGWTITEDGLKAVDSNCIVNVDSCTSSIAFANSLKCISEDLHAMLRCGIVPTEKWVSSTCNAIDSVLKLHTQA